MSVQSEINRISGNVTAALAAIAEKGVTVDSGSTSDDLATLIAAIETGGGGGKYSYGTFQLSEEITLNTTTPYTFEHGLGQKPDFVILSANRVPSSTYTLAGACYLGENVIPSALYGNVMIGISAATGSSVNSGNYRPLTPKNFDNESQAGCTTDDKYVNLYSSNARMLTSYTWAWVAGVIG